MFEINGKYSAAKVFTDNCEAEAIAQITNLLNQEMTKGQQVRIMPDCLPSFTEVLTINGFKSISELTMSDEVANYNNETQKVVFRKPKSIINRPLREGEKIYEFKSNQNYFSFFATENHRMLTKNGVLLAKDIPEVSVLSDYIYFSDGVEESITTKYSDIDILLLCWIVGDGSISDNGCGTVRVKFSFKKERKIKRIVSLLNRYGATFLLRKEKRGETSITINAESSKKLILLLPNKEKRFPNDFLLLSSHQFELLKNEIIKIDGDYTNYCNGKGYRYSSTKKCVIDVLQACFCLNNHLVTSKLKKSRGSFSKNPLLYFNASNKDRCEYSKSGFHNNKIIKNELHGYSDNVYCIECDTSFFVIRQNGLTMITGNCHAGAGCTIGTTMTITDKVVPNLVGVDISCGMLVCELGKADLDLEMLDKAIRERVPSGFSIRSKAHALASTINLEALRCVEDVNLDRAYKSVGTLGGGNHFIELNKDDEGNLYLVIHSGSRHLGLEVAKHYQKAAYSDLCAKGKTDRQAVINAKIAELKEQGRASEIEAEIQKLKAVDIVPEELAYCEGKLFKDYIHDMAIVQSFAEASRAVMANEILFGMGINTDVEKFTTLHNYIDLDNMILRKGAVSAQKGERLIIPMNMRDGSLICVGKGNPDWNYSAPHGAGRLMSRSKAKEMINLDEFQKSMEGIYTTSVGISTIDEAPMAYKPMNEIIANIGDTVEIERIIKPVYNFKAN